MHEFGRGLLSLAFTRAGVISKVTWSSPEKGSRQISPLVSQLLGGRFCKTFGCPCPWCCNIKVQTNAIPSCLLSLARTIFVQGRAGNNFLRSPHLPWVGHAMLYISNSATLLKSNIELALRNTEYSHASKDSFVFSVAYYQIGYCHFPPVYSRL